MLLLTCSGSGRKICNTSGNQYDMHCGGPNPSDSLYRVLEWVNICSHINLKRKRIFTFNLRCTNTDEICLCIKIERLTNFVFCKLSFLLTTVLAQTWYFTSLFNTQVKVTFFLQSLLTSTGLLTTSTGPRTLIFSRSSNASYRVFDNEGSKV